MGVNKGWWGIHRGVDIPAGLILGLEPGVTISDGWSVWSSADGSFLKGTDSDNYVGTKNAANTISYTSGSGGSHTGGRGYVSSYGQGKDTRSNLNSPSNDDDPQGNHEHVIMVNYTPRSCRMKLVMAGATAKLFEGLIGFATQDLVKHTPYTLFDGDSGYLQANTSTAISGSSTSAYVVPASDYHDHIFGSLISRANGVGTGGYPSTSARGGNHGHGISAAGSANLQRSLVRAFAVLDLMDIDGLIGIWLGTGALPTGWELATELTYQYLKFSSTGDGAQSGNNTLSVSAYTGGASHGGHLNGSPGEDFDALSDIHHPETVSHNHSASGTRYFEPNRYHVKFIRKTT